MKRCHNLNVMFVLIVFLIMMSTVCFGGFLVITFVKLGLLSIDRPSRLVPFLIIVISSVILGTITSAIVSRRLLKPLNDLITATKEVAKGNYQVEVPMQHSIHSELDTLIESFNHMTQELAGVELMHRNFINDFSHEFKTPIVSIQGFAKQLENPDIDEQTKREYTAIIRKETNRLTHLSSNILYLTRLENQHIVTNRTWYALDEQLRSCIVLLQEKWEDKHIELHLSLDEIKYYGNEEMMAQVWVNMLDNAIKYTPQDGDISVSCYRYGKALKVKIQDSGPGMSDKVIHHIFDKFYQGDSAHKSEGNGLGLAITKRILELHNGEIYVKGNPSKGTVFTIVLPCETQQESTITSSII